jgi:hypothetical protein
MQASRLCRPAINFSPERQRDHPGRQRSHVRRPSAPNPARAEFGPGRTAQEQWPRSHPTPTHCSRTKRKEKATKALRLKTYSHLLIASMNSNSGTT